ncbi:MAG: hypothetical protein AB1Z98_25895 [Nannocystaceae bacterium]
MGESRSGKRTGAAPQGSPPGPVERVDWPRTLEAHAWTDGPRPRLHGYDLHDDLARHYGFAELVLTSLGGTAPSREQGRVFETVLSYLMPSTAAEAPAHCAILARTFMARWPAVVASGATVLAEQTEALLDEQAALLAWLDAPTESLPACARCDDEPERAAVGRLRVLLGEAAPAIGILALDPGLLPALLAAAHHCGLRDRERLASALVLARLPAVMAEALPRASGELRRYPMNTPDFVYRPEAQEPPPDDH